MVSSARKLVPSSWPSPGLLAAFAAFVVARASTITLARRACVGRARGPGNAIGAERRRLRQL